MRIAKWHLSRHLAWSNYYLTIRKKRVYLRFESYARLEPSLPFPEGHLLSIGKHGLAGGDDHIPATDRGSMEGEGGHAASNDGISCQRK